MTQCVTHIWVVLKDDLDQCSSPHSCQRPFKVQRLGGASQVSRIYLKGAPTAWLYAGSNRRLSEYTAWKKEGKGPWGK